MKKRFDLRLWTGIGALALVVGGIAAPHAQAETVAWWRMDGTAGTSVTSTQNGTAWNVGIADFSGNGNALGVTNTTGTSVAYNAGMPPVITGPNTSSVNKTPRGSEFLFTWSPMSHPTGTDIEAKKFTQFTVEGFAKPATGDIAGTWDNIATWEGGDIHRVFKLASASASYAYYRLTFTEANGGGGNNINLTDIRLMDASGNNIATTATGTVTDSTHYTGEAGSNAFDPNMAGTVWTTNGTLDAEGGSVWVQIHLNTPGSISSYSLLPRGPVWQFGNRAPKAWTLAGSNDGTNWTTIDTKTGVAMVTPDASPFELQIDNNSKWHAIYIDAAGVYHEAIATANAVADHWYYVAATMDGTSLKLWGTDLSATPVQPVSVWATTDVSASSDTSMIAQPDTVGPGFLKPRKSWAVGRGYYQSGNGNNWDGLIDEIRVSDAALDISTKGLIAVGVPVTISNFQAE